MSTADFIEVSDTLADAVEVFEGGIVLSLSSTSVLTADSVNLVPPIGGASNVQVILQRLFDGYTHTQTTPALVWNITHSLGWLPTYSLSNLAGEPIQAAVEVTTTSATVTGLLPFTGILNLR